MNSHCKEAYLQKYVLQEKKKKVDWSVICSLQKKKILLLVSSTNFEAFTVDFLEIRK